METSAKVLHKPWWIVSRPPKGEPTMNAKEEILQQLHGLNEEEKRFAIMVLSILSGKGQMLVFVPPSDYRPPQKG